MTGWQLNTKQFAGVGCRLMPAVVAASVAAMVVVGNSTGKDAPSKKKKRIIGATAVLTEVGSGITFAARVDTGAETCSLHVERIEIQDKEARRLGNVGKTIRIKLRGKDGQLHWIEGVVADAVRVKSPSLPSGDYDHRYKVRLTLQWRDVRKEVLVTLNNRTDMEYPLLVGRNFLRGDFLVDVSKTDDEG
jgi:hypothetical protein